MSGMRETNNPSDAPVLFRLPHVQRMANGRPVQPSASGSEAGQAAAPSGYGTIAPPERTTSKLGQQERSVPISGHESASPAAGPDGQIPPPDRLWSLLSKQPEGMKQSVILVLILALMCGAWWLGRRSGTRTAEDLVAGQPSQFAPPQDTPGVQAEEMNLGTEQRSKSTQAQLANPQSVAVGKPLSISEPADDAFYGADDFDSATELNGPVGVSGSTPAILTNTLAKRSEAVLPGDTPFVPGGTPGSADLSGDSQTAGWYSDGVPMGETANGNFLKSDTPNALGFDPVRAVQSVSKFSVQPAPVLSPTPNGIADWSRYFPQTGPVRAASAFGPIGAGGETAENAGQAFYSEDGGVPSADSAVAPFYR